MTRPKFKHCQRHNRTDPEIASLTCISCKFDHQMPPLANSYKVGHQVALVHYHRLTYWQHKLRNLVANFANNGSGAT